MSAGIRSSTSGRNRKGTPPAYRIARGIRPHICPGWTEPNGTTGAIEDRIIRVVRINRITRQRFRKATWRCKVTFSPGRLSGSVPG
jgi:hypothetical protein